MIPLEITFSLFEGFINADLVHITDQKVVRLPYRVIAIIVSALIGFLIGTSGFSSLTLILIPIMIGFVLSLIYRTNIVRCLFFSITATFFAHLYDSLVFGLAGLILGEEQFFYIILSIGPERYVFGFFAKISFTVIYMLFRKQIRNSIDLLNSRGFRFIVLIGFAIVIFLSYELLNQLTFDVGMSILFFSSSIILMVALTYYYMKQKGRDRDSALIELRNDILAQNYQDILDVYHNGSIFHHDYKEHIIIIRDLMKSKMYDELETYIDDMDISSWNLDWIWTKDVVVNQILKNKISKAESQGIKVTTDIEFPELHNIQPSDLTSILSNILENAIEANESVKTNKWICISIKEFNALLIIKVTNPYYNSPKQQGERILTSKKDNIAHGWGIKSVQRSAEKYDGYVDIEIDEETKTFEITVSLMFNKNNDT